MAQKAGVGDYEGDEQVEDQRSCPSWDTVGSDGKVRISSPSLDRLGSQEKKDPNAAQVLEVY